MANNIETRVEWTTMLDEVFKNESKTSILDSNDEVVKAGANAHEVKVAKIDMDGLGNYNGSYTDGDVSFTWETKTFNYDRSKRLHVDAYENEETAGEAFGNLAGQFIRTKVVPEADTFRLSTYANKAGNKAENASFADGKAVLKALRACINTMDEAEVPEEGRVLFIVPTLYNMVADLDTTASRDALSSFSTIVKVPQARMNMVVNLNEDGYTTEAGKEINFLALVPQAVIQTNKHDEPKIFMSSENQNSRDHLFIYDVYGLAEVYDNKTDAIYVNARSLA